MRTALPKSLQGAAIDRVNGEWIVWLYTNNYIDGTYLHLKNDGSIYRVTEYEEQINECVMVKEGDKDSA